MERAKTLATPDWRRAIEPYVGSDPRRAIWQVVSTLLPLAASIAAIHYLLAVQPLFAFLLVLPTAGLLVRTFILMHDAAHSSFFANRRLNDALGWITGVLTFTPFAQWRRDHALHHASSGDLDRRGNGDVPTITVREYLARTPRQRLLYRLVRNPLALLTVGPLHLMVNQRWRGRSLATGGQQLTSVWSTNAGILALLIAGILLLGWQTVLLAWVLPFYIAGMGGIWLFYVQHQFEEAYWADHGEWSYVEAALHGSSHLKLPPVLQWFTGSIGLHHIHHLAPRIPNYRLQRCHDENRLFQDAPVVTFRSGMSALRLALWDETQRRMVRFADVHAAANQRTA